MSLPLFRSLTEQRKKRQRTVPPCPINGHLRGAHVALQRCPILHPSVRIVSPYSSFAKGTSLLCRIRGHFYFGLTDTIAIIARYANMPMCAKNAQFAPAFCQPAFARLFPTFHPSLASHPGRMTMRRIKIYCGGTSWNTNSGTVFLASPITETAPSRNRLKLPMSPKTLAAASLPRLE